MTLISPIALVLSSLLLLPTQYSASSLLLVAGGHSNNSLAVEVWPPLLAPDCTLPALPEERWGASLDVQATRPVLCGLSSCWQLSAGVWLNVGDTLQSRWYHSSAKTSEGLLLVGGSGSPNTTELLPIEGGQNTQGTVGWHEFGPRKANALLNSGFKLEHGVDRGQAGEHRHQLGHQLQLGDGGRSRAFWLDN